MNKILGIIPARYASTRFPGKPLIDIKGKSMIERTYRQAEQASGLDLVVVATDDMRIAEEVKRFGGRYIMTKTNHQSGTDRCAEVVGHFPDYDAVINIQGDEPFIQPAQINLLAQCLLRSEVHIATLVKRIEHEAELFNVNIPKVVTDLQGKALYFSRHPIPYIRNKEEKEWLNNHTYFKHIGIYGYRISSLLEITRLKASALEESESLEQLRWLENGFSIYTAETHLESLAIDSPEDLLKLDKL